MFLLNSCLSLFSAAHFWAPLIPKLRGHFAEFLNNASPAGLRILSSSTCVGLRYGYLNSYSGFSRRLLSTLRYFHFAPHRTPAYGRGFSSSPLHVLAPGFPFPARALPTRPHISVLRQYRIFSLLSISYASQPRLRPRLTQGRSALPWKPWIFGHEDSHFILATHSGILSSCRSTAPYGTASMRQQCSSTNHLRDSQASVWCFSPGHCRRRTSRVVSYYALFQ